MDQNLLGTIVTPHGTKLTPVPPEKRRMKILLNGIEITEPIYSLVLMLKTDRADFQYVYGLSPAGYDDVARREIGGGGVIDTLFTIINGMLYIGVITQNRQYQSDKPIRNSIRGYLDPGKSHFESANAEAEEEGGISGLTIFELPGDPGNSNNASEESWGGGLRHFGIFAHPSKLEPSDSGYVFTKGAVKAVDSAAEGVLKCEFIPWVQAAQLGCHMTGNGLVRLLAYLYQVGGMTVKFGNFSK